MTSWTKRRFDGRVSEALPSWRPPFRAPGRALRLRPPQRQPREAPRRARSRAVRPPRRPTLRAGARRYPCPAAAVASHCPYRSRRSSRYRSLTRELLGEALKRPMLEHTHRSRLLPQDLGDVGHVKPGKHAEQNHLSLVGRKRGDARQRGFGVVGGEDGALGVVRPRSPAEGIEAGTRVGAALPAAPMIDQPPTGDREEPAPKRPLVTSKAFETGGRVKPRLRDEILAIVGFLRPKVPQEPGMELPVQRRERPLRPRPRSGQHGAELPSECHGCERSCRT